MAGNPEAIHLNVLSPMLRLARAALGELLPPGRHLARNPGVRRSSGYDYTIEASLTGWKHFMDALLEKLDTKLREWKPETADQVRARVAEIIDVADQDALDILRSRAAEQEVLNLLDEPAPR